MSLDQWLPTDRQRNPKPAPPPTVAQMRRRLQRARRITENAKADPTAQRMAARLVTAWEPGDMVAQALEDLQSSSTLSRQEAHRFLAVCAPDKLPTVGEGNRDVKRV